ncbi:MAG: tetratricopeptide repeat protein [Deltaproteobacteria bacterium]|nr:tetratricopeptide repeat protein [Deltaproteobacteria bacterium]
MRTRTYARVVAAMLPLMVAPLGLPTLAHAEPAADDESTETPAEPDAPADADAATDAAPDGAEPEEDIGAGIVLDPEVANRQNAEAAYREGSELYEVGKYGEAVDLFKRAWELSKEVQLLFNLGQAYWKWYDVDPEVDHLRQAAVFFRNYDKRMRLTDEYDPFEITNILKAIDAQIEVHERREAEANRPVIVQPGGPTEEELKWQQRQRATRGLNVSGTTLIVVGGVTLAAGIGALVSRVAFKLLLDSSSTSDGGLNIATADEDARRRQGFLLSGQISFGTLIAAAVIAPVGIALRVTGAVRDKKDRARAREKDQERERNLKKAKVAIHPGLTGLTVRF